MYCTHCGHQNPVDANFCGNCGRPLGKPSDQTTGALRAEDIAESTESVEPGFDAGTIINELEPGTALLVAVRGPNRGSRFLLDRDVITVGRHPDSDIFLDDITVSRRHAELRRDELGNYVVRDVGSLNGTYVNRTRVDEAQLADGDELQIGMFKLVFFHGTKR